MPAYSEIASATVRKPPRKVVLQPSAFADTWSGKPGGDIAIGLRLLSEADVQTAKAEAEVQARRWYADPNDGEVTHWEGLTDAYNDGVMRHCLARACVDVNDVTVSFFESAEDTVRNALTPEGVARLWDELTLLHAASGIRIAAADDEEIARLARVLADGHAVAALDKGEAIELRKLLGYCLSMLVATGAAHEKTNETEGGDYHVSSA